MTAVPPSGSDPTAVQPTGGMLPPAGNAPVVRVPQFVGQRVEAAADTARLAGWALVPEFTEPTLPDQPEGLVVAQQPSAGNLVTSGSVLALTVVRRRAWMDRNGRSLFLGLAVVFAVLAVVFAVLWSTAGGSTDTDTLQAENASLRAENAALKDQVAAAAGADGELVKTLQKQVADLTAKLTAAETAATKAQADLAAVTKERDALKAERDKLQADLDAALKDNAALRAQLGGIQQSVTPMPGFVGQQQVAVEDFAKTKKLQLVVEKVKTSSSPAAPGTVLVQQPKAGIPLVEGSAVWIQVYAP